MSEKLEASEHELAALKKQSAEFKSELKDQMLLNDQLK